MAYWIGAFAALYVMILILPVLRFIDGWFPKPKPPKRPSKYGDPDSQLDHLVYLDAHERWHDNPKRLGLAALVVIWHMAIASVLAPGLFFE